MSAETSEKLEAISDGDSCLTVVQFDKIRAHVFWIKIEDKSFMTKIGVTNVRLYHRLTHDVYRVKSIKKTQFKK